MSFIETNCRMIPTSELPPGAAFLLRYPFPALRPWISNYTKKSYHRCSEEL
jgi:hypothetical protein